MAALPLPVLPLAALLLAALFSGCQETYSSAFVPSAGHTPAARTPPVAVPARVIATEHRAGVVKSLVEDGSAVVGVSAFWKPYPLDEGEESAAAQKEAALVGADVVVIEFRQGGPDTTYEMGHRPGEPPPVPKAKITAVFLRSAVQGSNGAAPQAPATAL